MQSTTSLAVESEVLRERLANQHLEPPGLKIVHGIGVLINATAEALVRNVEDREMPANLHLIRQCVPLILREVCGRRVMAASLQYEWRTLRRGSRGLQNAVEINRTSSRVVMFVKRCVESD